jgi:hypothetical protein
MDPIKKPKDKRTYRDRREYFKAYHKKKYAEDAEFRINVIERSKKSYLKKCLKKATDPCGCVCDICLIGDKTTTSPLPPLKLV